MGIAASQRVVSLPPLPRARGARALQSVPQDPQALAPRSSPSAASRKPPPHVAEELQAAQAAQAARSKSAPRVTRGHPRGQRPAVRRHGQGAVQGLEWSSPEAWHATEHRLQRLLGTASEVPTACPHCGRKFRPDSLARHSRVCVNVFQKQQKAFDALRQRVPLEWLTKVRRLKAKAEVGRIPSSWRQRSRAFRHAVREARHASLSKGRPLRRGSSVDLNEKSPCPHCGRKFLEVHLAQHAPVCRAKAPRAPQSDDTVEPRAAGRLVTGSRDTRPW